MTSDALLRLVLFYFFEIDAFITHLERNTNDIINRIIKCNITNYLAYYVITTSMSIVNNADIYRIKLK